MVDEIIVSFWLLKIIYFYVLEIYLKKYGYYILMAFREEVNKNLFYNLPDHLQNKIIQMNRHPIADLIVDYKENWYYDYREKYFELPDEHNQEHYYDFYDTKDLSEELWGSKVLKFYKNIDKDSDSDIYSDNDDDDVYDDPY